MSKHVVKVKGVLSRKTVILYPDVIFEFQRAVVAADGKHEVNI